MIQAIETSYKGYRFRSRLEARWAVAFDHMGLRWEYEPEGFVLPDGTKYLPDFKIYPVYGEPFWIEVKPWGQSVAKFEAFMREQEAGVFGFVLHGIPEVASRPFEAYYGKHDFLILYEGEKGIGDYDYRFAECLGCNSVSITFDGRDDRIGCECYDGWRTPRRRDGRIERAFDAARQARFEHGQVGAPV